ncbi:MAG: zinc finger domain-containing protein [Nanobdellota archaeon]
MEVSRMECSSTHTNITNMGGTARFMCPKCGEYEIVRSKRARELAMKYNCPKCGFEGPN